MAGNDLSMAKQIAKAVGEMGGHTYFVGGCVRDRIMKIENKDIDIEIHGITAEELERILDRLGKRTEMGISFGIYGLKGYDLDIAMPRKEEATGRGHRDFKVYVDPFLGTYKAALRRDFTMNALMEDVLTGEIVDHFGGIEDLKKGILRHVNSHTFAEDPLRVLRAAQFAARFGFEVDKETVELAKTMDLEALASERIYGELYKGLLKAERPSIFFENMRKMEQLSTWFSELEQTIGVKQDPIHHPEGDVWTHTMMVLDEAAKYKNEAENPAGFMLSALCHDFGKVTATEEKDGRIRSIGHETEGLVLVKRFMRRITNEVKLNKYVLNMVELHMQPNRMAAQHSGRKATNKMFDRSVDPYGLLLLSRADHFGKANAGSYEMEETFLKKRLQEFEEVMARPYVMGADLVAAGLKPGNYFSELLSFAHKLRLAGVEKEEALKQTLAYERTLK